MSYPNLTSLGNLHGQTLRVQHNVKALSFLREMQDALRTPEKARQYAEGMTFTIQMGAGTDDGKAAATILRKTVQNMLPLIVGHAIAAAEAGNKEALATIVQLAETLGD